MKQRTKRHIAKVLVCNIAKLMKAVIIYIATEIRFRIKWIKQDLAAIMKGYRSHSRMIQHHLDHNHKIYGQEKQYEGYYYGGKIHRWEDMKKY